MSADWILRVGDGSNLISSSKYRIWGIQSSTSLGKHFIKNVKPGDRLWFVKSKSNGKLLAVTTYRSHNARLGGQLVASMTNEELGWTGEGSNWTSDVEIHYSDLYKLDGYDLLTHIKGAASIRKYDEKCRVDLPVEYSYIARYSKTVVEL